jgi:hypothetical protein
MARMPADPRDLLQRYLPYRRYFEAAFWVAFYLLGAVVNTVVAQLDIARVHLAFARWEPAVWEWTSHLASLALLPAVVVVESRFPLRFGSMRASLPWHAVASVAYSVIHVLAMVGARMAIYASQNLDYDFGYWPREFFYEYLKDFRSYVLVLLIIGAYRFLLFRLQGEATLLDAPDSVPAEGPIERPEHFLVKKLGKAFLLPTAEIQWAQAMGNYVKLRVGGRDYPLRATMQAIEARLDPSRFARVHPSYIVNRDQVAGVEPTEGGDARIRMKDGAEVPCSRRYRDVLRSAP